MKGKNTFTSEEIKELRKLIKKRVKADRSSQKGIRAKIRKIGFYGRDDFGIIDLQISDLDRLIKSKRIHIVDQQSNFPLKTVQRTEFSPIQNLSDASKMGEFRLFDPQKNNSGDLPDNPGNYIVCLKKGAKLPDIGEPYVMESYKNLKVIYTGISGSSLRKRDYRQHFMGNNAGRSTLRKSLGSMFGYPKIPRDRDPNTGKTKFGEIDEAKLSEWMHSNLVLFFMSNPEPNTLEDELIKKFNPPLNLSKNKSSINKSFRKRLSGLRGLK